jgi:hypothetical protein
MGGPELLVVLAIAWPVVAALWLARVMHRLRSEQRAIRHRLEVIEQSLQRDPPR